MRSIQFLHRHRTVLLAVLLAQFTLYNPGAARAERLTPQLHLQRAQLDAPVVSPDGQYAAFIVSRLDSATDSSNSSLWLLELETGEYRQLTHAGNVSDLAWDGDGGAIYFKRQQQVWRLPLTGGEAVTVTAVPGGIGSYRINPNRNAPPAARMLFTKDMSPDCPPTDWDCLDAVKKARKAAPGMATEALPLRHWNRWRTDLEGAVYLGDPATGNWRLVTACDGPREPLALASGAEISFSPDGARIAVIRNPDLGTQTALSTDNNIYLLETDAVLAATDSIAPWDTATLLSQGLSEGGGNDDNPVFSPDGRWLAYTSMKRAGCESDLRLINLYNLATGEERCLTCGLDRSAGGLTWSRDSRYLYFGAYDRESTALYRVEISGGKIERLLRSGSLSGVTALADGNLLLLLGSSRMPSELFLCDPDALAAAPEQWQADLALCVDGRFGVPDSATSDSASTEPESSLSALRQLTFFNRDWLEPLKMNPPDHFWFIGARDDAVHGFIIRPPAETTESEQNPVPLVMVFHGGPQWAYHDFWLQSYNFQMIAAAGYAVAVINFHGSTGFGYDFQDGIRGHWGDVPEEDVLRGLDYIVTHYGFVDSTRIAGIGRSYGGYLANWLNGRSERFRCFVSHSGSYNQTAAWGTTEELWFPEWEFHGTPWTHAEIYNANSPSTYAGQMRTPALIIHGQRDYRVDLSEGLQMYTTLKRQGIEARFLTFEDEGHHIRTPEAWRLMWKEIIGWLARYLN